MANFFGSFGWKRYLAALIGTLTSIAVGIPVLAPLIPVLTWAAAVLGGTGVTHASVKGTIAENIPSTIASVIAVLLLICETVPQLAWAVPALQLLAAIFGGATLATGVSKKKK